MKNGHRKKTPVTSPRQTNTDVHAQVALRAYQLWQAGGCCPGRDLDHWLEAERSLEKNTTLLAQISDVETGGSRHKETNAGR